MNTEINILEVYSSEDVLNPFLLLFNDKNYKFYYHYFKRLNRPNNVNSLIGVIIEFPIKKTSNIFLQKETSKIIETLQLHSNQSLKLRQNRLLFTIFNTHEKMIINNLLFYLSKFTEHKLYPIIGMIICHPLISPNEFITLSDRELNNAKKSNCILSVYKDQSLE